MVNTPVKKLTKAEFWTMADTTDLTYELIDGIPVAKMSPKYFHSRTGKIYALLNDWATNRGRVGIKWAIDLTDDFTPVPDLDLYLIRQIAYYLGRECCLSSCARVSH